MTEPRLIEGIAAPLPIANLDTDQIMPKQFLRGIDKRGLADGLLYDLRFDEQGAPRTDFVLNRPEYAGTCILIGGANFGCGSSREHAVWGLKQYGIDAIVAPSYAEIFHGNAMNNRLLLIALTQAQIETLLAEAAAHAPLRLTTDLERLTLRSPTVQLPFALSPRYHRMFLTGSDLVGDTLASRPDIEAFAAAHWQRRPWLRDVGRLTWDRLHPADPDLQEQAHV